MLFDSFTLQTVKTKYDLNNAGFLKNMNRESVFCLQCCLCDIHIAHTAIMIR